MIASLRAALIALVTVSAMPAVAATFEVRRSISTDLWVEWPGAERWNDAEVIAAFPEWRRHVSDADFAELKAAGFDTVRMPIEPAFLLHDADPERLAAIMAGIDAAIAMIVDSGLNVIVDMHTIPRGSGDAYAGTDQIMASEALFARYADTVAQVAGHLERWPAGTVALEVINEPTLDCYDRGERDRWARMLEALHGAARAANGDITLVLTGACWGSADGLAALDPDAIGDDNVIWTFHSYEPFMVTHQGATWAGDIVAHLRDIPWPPDAIDADAWDRIVTDNERRIRAALAGRAERRTLDFLRDHARDLRATDDPMAALAPPFATVSAWADAHDIARQDILLGEFGMIGREWGTDLNVPAQYRLNYMRAMIGKAEAHGFGWSVWSFGGAFGLVQGYGGERLGEPLHDRLIWTLMD